METLARQLKPLGRFDHSRDGAGLVYVYPVVSRRAKGVSVGINLNPNNACNWRCVYCQVPGLTRGRAPAIDLGKLEWELRGFLHELLHGHFMQERVPPEFRRINDIALSGNGEPTSAREFPAVIRVIGRVRVDLDLPHDVKQVLITNGSLMDRAYVQEGVREMAPLNGEVWFKLDSATREGIQRINNNRISVKHVRENLAIAASLCPTWLQTCMFTMDGQPPSPAEQDAYLQFVADALREGVPLQGVLLYGLARPSMQPEAPRLAPVSARWMEAFGAEIRALGLTVKVSP